MKSLPTLLLEAERDLEELFLRETDAPVALFKMDASDMGKLKSFLRETILSILAEAERATEGLQGQRLKYINEDKQLNTEFDIALNAVKSLWRKFRGNLK